MRELNNISSLISGIKRIDSVAWHEIYQRVCPELIRYARQLTRNEHDAQTHVFDALARLFFLAKNGDLKATSSGEVRAFLYATIRGLFLNTVKRSKRFQSEHQFDQMGDDGESPSETPVTEEEVSRTFSAIYELPELERLVIVGAYLDGANDAELGKKLGKDRGTVRRARSRALRKLRHGLQKIE